MLLILTVNAFRRRLVKYDEQSKVRRPRLLHFAFITVALPQDIVDTSVPFKLLLQRMSVNYALFSNLLTFGPGRICIFYQD